MIDCEGALTEYSDEIRGDRIVVQFIGEHEKFVKISRTSGHRGNSTTFTGEVCCTVVSAIRSRIHKI